jgi:plasmid maintenance system antidote protein VapI
MRRRHAQLAGHIGCDVKVINRIVDERTSVTAGMAIRLGAALTMTPEC